MTIKRFEDIEVWKLSRSLVKRIYVITDNELFRKDFGLKDQIRRACVSIMANIAEGFERQTSIEFIRYLFVSKASSGEAGSHLYVAFDLGYITESDFKVLTDDLEKISKSLSGFIKYLKTSNKK